MPSLKRINLNKGHESNHPDIKIGKLYLADFGSGWHVGTFNKQWYGLNFDCNWGNCGIQFDTPGYNCSSWQHLYEIQYLPKEK